MSTASGNGPVPGRVYTYTPTGAKLRYLEIVVRSDGDYHQFVPVDGSRTPFLLPANLFPKSFSRVADSSARNQTSESMGTEQHDRSVVHAQNGTATETLTKEDVEDLAKIGPKAKVGPIPSWLPPVILKQIRMRRTASQASKRAYE